MDTSDDLNEEQRGPVYAPMDAHIRIVACPGSGKSRCLSARVRHLLSSGVATDAIKVVTFSRQAAAEISRRLPDDVDVQTIHAMARKYEVCSQQYVGSGVGCLFGVNGDGRKMSLDDKSSVEGPFVSVDEHVYRFKRLLESPEGVTRVAALGVPDYLLVDEFQDLDSLQYSIVKMLCELFRCRLFAVGDKNQNIYGFRKSSSKYLDRVPELPHHRCYAFTLTKNYRSTPAIVALCNHIRPDRPREQNSHAASPEMESARVGALKPRVVCFKAKRHEVDWVLGFVMDLLLHGGHRSSDVAVVCRTQKDCYAFCHKFVERGVTTRVLLGDDVTFASTEGLSVCTMHGSKGLEWKAVVLVGCSDFYNRCLLTGEDVVQEENLFYVASTRAKDLLIFTSPAKCMTRLLSEVPRSLYDVVDDPPGHTIRPLFLSFGKSPFVRSSRSVTHFVNHASGEVYASLKESGIIPEVFPGASLVRVHAPFSPSWGADNALLFSSLIERVIYMQVNEACRARIISAGGDPEAVRRMRSMDSHANACFMYVTEDKLNLASAVSEEFGLPQNYVRVCDDSTVPAYVKIGEALYSQKDPYKVFFDIRVGRIRTSYKRYIRNEVDYNTEEGLKSVLDVALCSFLAYPPARTHLLFRKEEIECGVLGGLFRKTKGLVEEFVAGACESGPRKRKRDAVAPPEAADSSFFMDALGVGFDVNLSSQSLHGVADLIFGTTIVDIKCSLDSKHNSNVQMAWVLQLLIYAALAGRKGIRVEHIAIYNPLRGLFWKAPISHWGSQAELLDAVLYHLAGDVGITASVE